MALSGACHPPMPLLAGCPPPLSLPSVTLRSLHGGSTKDLELQDTEIHEVDDNATNVLFNHSRYVDLDMDDFGMSDKEDYDGEYADDDIDMMSTNKILLGMTSMSTLALVKLVMNDKWW
ncbi:hypothetical protein CFOL_v3_34717 [Cephalotus follicularis]|uniref:Uncharacterized protein n=1 Tax=Cephalotus follicularis TaxID=3775 RepID=A0A1Q3DFV1_CEPFO|nr:hypothetical protein CFOL_v3_34717 [Cephalotus follicularis]